MKYKIIADYHNTFSFLYKITVIFILIYGLTHFFAWGWEVYDIGAIDQGATPGSRFLMLFVLPIALIISGIIGIKFKTLKNFTIAMAFFILLFSIVILLRGYPQSL